VAPVEYWDLYGPRNGTFPLAPAAHRAPATSGTRTAAARPSDGGGAHELQAYAGVPPDLAALDGGSGPPHDARASNVTARQLRHGYAAAASSADAQLGRVVAALASLELDRSTVVACWSDHGFRLGDGPSRHWGKNSNAEVDARVPLVVALPTAFAARFLPHARAASAAAAGGRTSAAAAAAADALVGSLVGEAARGVKSFALVELVDLFPTLLHLAGVATLAHGEGAVAASAHPLEGSSFARLLLNGSLAAHADRPGLAAGAAVWKRAAFSQVRRGKGAMGYSARTQRYRITVWVDLRKLGKGGTGPAGDDVGAAAAWRKGVDANRRGVAARLQTRRPSEARPTAQVRSEQPAGLEEVAQPSPSPSCVCVYVGGGGEF
jgi:hypothetical protein